MTVHKPGSLLGLAAPAIADMVVNSAYCYISQLGTLASKSISVTGTPTGAQNVNLFTLVGGVEILRLYGVFSLVTDVSAVTAASFDLIDGTNPAVPITSAAGEDLSGCSNGSFIGRNDQAGVKVDYLNADQVRIIDGAVGLDLFAPLVANAMYGETNYIRFNYTSDGGGAIFKIDFELIWRPLIREYGLVEAV
ncbi:MAG TPA: hypothetical protein VMW53_07250 [archaeon]|nr:hypothetical protein [archaeon]